MLSDDVVKAYEAVVALGVNPGVLADFSYAVRNVVGAAYANSTDGAVDYPMPDGSIVMITVAPGTPAKFRMLDALGQDLGETPVTAPAA